MAEPDININYGQPDKSPQVKKVKTVVTLLAVLLVLVALFALYQSTKQSATTQPESISVVGQKVYVMHIDKAKISKGPSVITVKKGDKVHLKLSATNMGEADVRIAAYGLNTGVIGNAVGDMEFTADKTGTFPIEVREEDEDAHTDAEPHSLEETPWNKLGTLVVK